MSGKRFRALIVAALLALTMAIGATPLEGPPVVSACAVGSTTGGGC
jgi:hypothetical protein